MASSATDRAIQIKRSIAEIRLIVGQRALRDVLADRPSWLAFERLLEIISEASRHLPEDWKQDHGRDLPWRQIAGLGNFLRHAYDNIHSEILWDIYTHDLAPLEAAIDAMIAANPPIPPPPASP